MSKEIIPPIEKIGIVECPKCKSTFDLGKPLDNWRYRMEETIEVLNLIKKWEQNDK